MSFHRRAILPDSPTGRRLSPFRRRPRLEPLEDRTVLSMVVPADGHHHFAAAAMHHHGGLGVAPDHALIDGHHGSKDARVAALETRGDASSAGHHAAVALRHHLDGAGRGHDRHLAASHHRFRRHHRAHGHSSAASVTSASATATATATPTATPSPTSAPTPTAAPMAAPLVTPAPAATSAPADPTLLTLSLNPINLNLLGLNVQLYGATTSSPVTVTVSAQPGSGQLLGNLLTDAAGLLNVQGVSNALDNVLNSVVGLVNQSSLSVAGQSGSTSVTSTTQVLDAYIAPVNLDLLGAIVTTSPINLVIQAHAGPGQALGNIVTDLANLLNNPTGNVVKDVENGLTKLLNTLNQQFPTISPSLPTPSPTPTPTATGTSSGSFQLLSLTVPPIDLNLLGLILQTSTIQVNATSQSANGNLLGNLINDLLDSVHASQSDLNTINSDLNGVLDKVIGVLNAATLTLPSGAVSSLSPTLQELASPTLIDTTGASVAPEPVLNLSIASPSSTPPVDVDLLGVVVTTSNIQVQLLAQPGQGQVLGNLVYNASHLLDGGLLSVLGLLNSLGV